MIIYKNSNKPSIDVNKEPNIVNIYNAYLAYKTRCEILEKEIDKMKALVDKYKNDSGINLEISPKLLSFQKEWSKPVKHFRSDLKDEDILDLYNSGINPYQIAKRLQSVLGCKVSYRTIISRLKKIKAI